MNCNICQENITPYIDNELDMNIKDEMSSHLEECQRCKELYLSEYAVKMLVQKKCNRVAVPEDLRRELQEEIKSSYSKRSSLFLKKRVQSLVVYAAAAVLIISIISIIKMNPWQKNDVALAKILLPKEITYVSKSENIITLEGVIVCICCEMGRNGAHSECRKYGHTYGIKTDNGVLWTIMRNSEGMKVIDHREWIGERVKITGKFLVNGNYVDIREFNPVDYAHLDSGMYSLVK